MTVETSNLSSLLGQAPFLVCNTRFCVSFWSISGSLAMDHHAAQFRNSDTDSLDDVFMSNGETGVFVASEHRSLHPDPFLEMFHQKIKALAGDARWPFHFSLTCVLFIIFKMNIFSGIL